ncbi:MAG: phosphoenolpyruvate carboxylase [Oligoflexales bacterium]|nr:phosphoenolpyruvate carboxylase [Oligoflexales bacterium]
MAFVTAAPCKWRVFDSLEAQIAKVNTPANDSQKATKGKHMGEDILGKGLRFVFSCLSEVAGDMGYSHLPTIMAHFTDSNGNKNEDQLTWGEREDPERFIQLYSVVFQLLSMVEEIDLINSRRQTEGKPEGSEVLGLWPWAIKRLQEDGTKEQDLADICRQTYVEPVLTAHPTEAKRATVLEHHRELFGLLQQYLTHDQTPIEHACVVRDTKMVLERLLRTGEIFRSRPDLPSEYANIRHYMKNIFPQVLAMLDDRFAWAYQSATGKAPALNSYPQLRFGNWVGGDRDGHPNVSAELTGQVLNDLRLNALIVIRHKLFALGGSLSLSDVHQEPPKMLLDRLNVYKERYPQPYADALARNDGEPWRILLNLMVYRLPIEVVRQHATKLDPHEHSYPEPTELVTDLETLYDSLNAVGASRIADTQLRDALRLVETFGFYLARLDIRQNSQKYRNALKGLLDISGVMKEGESKKEELFCELVHSELNLVRPLVPYKTPLPKESEEILQYFTAIRDHVHEHGLAGVGSLIVSMTHKVEDLFMIYLFAREVGLIEVVDGGIACPLPVVPLFETIEDLKRSPQILESFLSHPVTIRSREIRRRFFKRQKPVQQVMIGYSDSCKDGGIIASQWTLYQAQQEMTRIAKKYDVELCFFHGRGGTISRGAGPAHRFMQALPHGSSNGWFRMTEQGETIAKKYANPETAAYHLEILMAGVATQVNTMRTAQEESFDDLPKILNFLADSSYRHYRELLEHPQFVTFFRQATPIDLLENARIGSRPPKRTGASSLDDLRAIPWVFSWNQARFYLPSWYGVGNALEQLQRQEPESFAQIQSAIERFVPLNYLLHNVEISVASASLSVMELYGSLVEKEEVRNHFMGAIEEEYLRTRRMIQTLFGKEFAVRRPANAEPILRREIGLNDLHALQVSLLSQWRKAGCPSNVNNHLLSRLFLTVNAIAGGLRNTG